MKEYFFSHRFYSDPKKNAFDFQNIVFDTYYDILSPPSSIVKVYERSPRSSLKVFSKASVALEHISESEMERLCCRYRKSFAVYELGHNYTIYLKAAPETIYNRMCHRGRPDELRQITLERVDALSKLHDLEYLNTKNVFVLDETSIQLSVESKAEAVMRALSVRTDIDLS